MKIPILSIFLLLCLSDFAVGLDGFYGGNSTQAIVRFKGKIEYDKRDGWSESAVKAKVRQQIYQAIGPLRVKKHSASFSPDFKIKILRLSRENRIVRAEYKFKGVMAIHAEVSETLPLILTTNPDLAMSKAGSSCFKDHTFPFWYYWNPKVPGCLLKKGIDYARVEAKVERLPNQALAYPEYERLVNRDDIIEVHAFFGPEARWQSDLDVKKTNDLGVKQYRKFRKALRQEGYSIRSWSIDEIRKVYPYTAIGSTVVEEASVETAKGKIVVRMFLGQPFVLNIFENSPFQEFYKDALENASVIFYSGHAGQGYNLDLGALGFFRGKIHPPVGRYQIIHFATCLSYTYYAQMYFAWKKSAMDPAGTKDLDVLGYAGGETLFKFMSVDTLNTLWAIRQWADGQATLSYQEIAERIKNAPFLFFASGIQDNP